MPKIILIIVLYLTVWLPTALIIGRLLNENQKFYPPAPEDKVD